MKKKVFSILFGMAMVAAGLTFASCGGDDDNTGGSETGGLKPAGKATIAYGTPVVLISEDMLNYFDATCIVDGQAVTLTKDNTTAFDTIRNERTYRLRKYTGPTRTYTKFPTITTLAEHITVKEGVDLNTIGRLDVAFSAYNEYTNNNVKHDMTSFSGKYGEFFGKGLDMSKVSDRFKDITLQSNDTLKSAEYVCTRYKFTYGSNK